MKMEPRTLKGAYRFFMNKELEDAHSASADTMATYEVMMAMLDKYKDRGKDPAVIAKGMSWIKTNVMLAMKDSDATVADLMTDGCNMGVKSLNRYLNQYKAADEFTKDITKRLIHLEEKLVTDIRCYL